MKLNELKEINTKKLKAYNKLVKTLGDYCHILWCFKDATFDTPLEFKEFCYIEKNHVRLNKLYNIEKEGN